ncbi:glycosyltransferase family 4 protein [Ornithinimicrobium cavernae]|uniref:glycosyltransferase family 4 protein n=1 Tax=Ornithinimicrobium cavernae TaxID=2666047 RepID=UPI00137A2D62|nr:glycosyltransferase family 4 protein [Ornithinimicrobium cavernae]
MRIIAIHRYFWPDSPPYASFLRRIAGRWAEDGHQVEVLAGRPSYESARSRAGAAELVDGFRIRRIPVLRDLSGGWRQLINLVAFPVFVSVRILLARSPDVVMCSTVPQVTLGWAVSVATRVRRGAFVYHCMDLHPEIGRISGEFRNPLLYRVLAQLDLATMRRAERIVVLSEDMRRAVLSRDPRLEGRVIVLNNWALPDFGEPEASPLPPPAEGVLRVVFTGNLGRFQGLEQVVSALAFLPPHVRIEVVFMGEGRAKSDVEQATRLLEAPGIDVLFLPAGSASAAKALMRTAHLGLVTLVPGVVRYAYPSKTATYISQGLPLLVLCEQDSALAQSVTRLGLGWSVAAGDQRGLVRALEEACQRLAEDGLASEREAVTRWSRGSFNESRVLQRWSEMLFDSVRGTVEA